MHRSGFSLLIFAQPKISGISFKKKIKKKKEKHHSASPSGLNDRKYLSFPCMRWHDIFLFTHR